MSSPPAKKSAKEGIELIESFVNTLHLDIGVREETIGDPASLREWIAEQAGLEVGELSAAEHACAIELREALRGLLLTHNGVEVDEDELAPLRRAAEEARLGISCEPGGDVSVSCDEEGFCGFESKLLLAVAEAQALGTWERLKACAAQECHWAFYDSSRNRSRTWCSMEVCGNRAKTRKYRRRRAKG